MTNDFSRLSSAWIEWTGLLRMPGVSGLFVNESAAVVGGYPRRRSVSLSWGGASVGDDSGSYTRIPHHRGDPCL